MKYVYTGTTFRFILCYISISPVSHKQYRRPDSVMDLVQCILGKFLVFPALAARCLYVCKDARESSGIKSIYLSNVCNVMLQK